MKLQETINKMNIGDIAKFEESLKEAFQKIDDEPFFVWAEGNYDKGKQYMFSHEDFTRDDWEIVPGKPKILNQTEYMGTLNDCGVWTKREVITAFRDGDKNGQRRIYYEGGVKELVDACDKLSDTAQVVCQYEVDSIKEALENIKIPD